MTKNTFNKAFSACRDLCTGSVLRNLLSEAASFHRQAGQVFRGGPSLCEMHYVFFLTAWLLEVERDVDSGSVLFAPEHGVTVSRAGPSGSPWTLSVYLSSSGQPLWAASTIKCFVQCLVSATRSHTHMGAACKQHGRYQGPCHLHKHRPICSQDIPEPDCVLGGPPCRPIAKQRPNHDAIPWHNHKRGERHVRRR